MAVVMMCYFFLLYLFLSNISLTVNSQHHHHHVCDPKQSLALLQFKNGFFQPTPPYPALLQFKNVFFQPPPPYPALLPPLYPRFSQCVHFLDGTFYRSPLHYRLSKWNESADCCLWDGVECDDEGQGHVVGLHLGCSLLHGTIHPNSTLFTLSHLKTLNLSNNYFSGSPISPQFGIMLTNLRVLDLSYSFFQGQVPMQISYLSKLVSLHLSDNYGLSFSNVVMNQLVHNLTNLKDLQLASTNLSNITPTSFINFSLSLASLDLSSCQLSGNFPDRIFSLPNLRMLKLGDNPELNGHLPMSNWSISLQILDLSQTNFEGEIPSSIGEAKTLRNLELSYCKFNGEIPNFASLSNPLIMGDQLVPNCVLNLTQTPSSSNSFTKVCSNVLPNLISLDLSQNSFTGSIPSWIYSLPNLKYLDLGINNFSGFMRDFRSNSLEYLDLSHNNLQGEISESIYEQRNLTQLGLEFNNLSGILNLDMLSRIQRLSLLDISNNRELSIFSTRANSGNCFMVIMSFIKLEKIPYFLRNQTNLRLLHLSNNQIVGNIPKWFSELGGLKELDLSHNFLSSGLQALIAMPALKVLILKSNNFSGIVHTPPSISVYIASENQFSGEIPHSICLAVNLTILNLSNNRINGTIPPCLAHMMAFLSVLDLKNNNFSGSIPNIISRSSSECRFRSLDLNGNQLEGELPQWLLYCKNLEVLDLGNNKMTGYFPYWLEFASSLRVLILRSNKFYGPINHPFNNDGFSNLRIIDLSHNNFSGPLPSNLFKHMRAVREVEHKDLNPFEGLIRRNIYYEDSIVISLKGLEQKIERILLILKTIDLSSNDFNGNVPNEIGMLRSLVGLNLSHNKLTDGIPTSLGNLNNLEWLDLSSNQLFGSIPPQLVALTFLSYLNLSQNQLSGPIPQGKQFDTFENSSYFGNLGLCGNPLPKCGVYPNDHKSQVLHEEEEGESSEKGIFVKAVFIGYGCGIVFGIFIGYVVFKYEKPMWIVAIVEGKRAQNIHTSRRSRRP